MNMPIGVVIFCFSFVRFIAIWPTNMVLYYLIKKEHSRSYYKKVKKQSTFLNRITCLCFWNISKDNKTLIRLIIVYNIFVIISSLLIIPITFLVVHYACDYSVEHTYSNINYWITAITDSAITIYALRLRDRWLRRNEKE